LASPDFRPPEVHWELKDGFVSNFPIIDHSEGTERPCQAPASTRLARIRMASRFTNGVVDRTRPPLRRFCKRRSSHHPCCRPPCRRPHWSKDKACNTTAALLRFGDIIAPISGGRNADSTHYRLSSPFPFSCSPELCPTRRRAHGRLVLWPRYFFFRTFLSTGSYGRGSPKVCWSPLLPEGRC
jgi:hypothetical protein